MTLNNYFNLKRFACLLKQDLLINRTKYLLGLLGLGLITYLLTYWFLTGSQDYMIRDGSTIYGTYGICFAIYMMAVGVIIGTAFPDLTNKIKTSNYLLNPGSTLEKVMLQFLIRIGFFVPMALFIFWLVIRLAKASLVQGESELNPAVIPYFEFRLLITEFNRIWETWQIVFLIFGLFSYGIYLFAGATYFKRYALVKTVIASVVILLISMSFSVLLSHIFYPQETKGFNTKFNEFVVVEQISSLELFFLLLSLLSWMFFLALAYFNLKEKEV